MDLGANADQAPPIAESPERACALAWHRSNPVSRRLATIPGIGPVIASAVAATVADPGMFKSGREFAAWLGLVPRQNSTGGKTRLGRISKQGNAYLRRLLALARARSLDGPSREGPIPG